MHEQECNTKIGDVTSSNQKNAAAHQVDAKPCHYANPEFFNTERAPYELPKLIARLGVPQLGTPLTLEQTQIAQAIEKHIDNATDTILNGIEAVGRALACSAQNPNWQLSTINLSDIGTLIAHLAVEAQSLHEIGGDIRVVLGRNTKDGHKGAAGARP